MRASDNPFNLFDSWFEEAKESEEKLPEAVALATASQQGMPAVRMVLLKGFGPDGFVFYTNLGSQKGKNILCNPNAALCFHWKSTDKQVRVEGQVFPVSEEEADTYFFSRDRASQIGAWASRQSQKLDGRFELEKQVALFAARYPLGKIPRPDFWSGFRIVPSRLEFWREGRFRLHDRLEFTLHGGKWRGQFLFP